MPDPFRPFTWNDRTGRYRDPRTGRFVTRRQVRTALDGAIRSAGQRAAALAADLRADRITLGAWETAMRQVVKDVHLYSVAAAVGGWAQMGAAEYGRVGAQVREQYGYLNAWAQDVAAGRATVNAGRAALYIEHGHTAYMEQDVVEARTRDLTEYRNVLGAAEHCDGCLAQTARGWVPMGSLIPIGSRPCRARDRCHYEYR